MIRVRIAPSPTGKLHLGTARTALLNFLFAKKNNGKFLLRFEDTDQARSNKEFEKDIAENLRWLGLYWDETPFYQMEHLSNYRNFAQKLVSLGLAEEVEGVVIFRAKKALTAAKIDFEQKPRIFEDSKDSLKDVKDPSAYYVKNIAKDLIHGEISGFVEDAVILRHDGIPTFHLAVVVDDEKMKISHVIRGDDHLSNTPLHVVLQKALGFKTPVYAHMPLILTSDRKKMSKRFGAVAVSDFKKEGYLPEALVSFLASLGIVNQDQKEMSLSEIEQVFKMEKVQKSPVVFSKEKLDFINGKWIKRLDMRELAKRIKDFSGRKLSEEIIAIIKERIKLLSDLPFWTNFFFTPPKISKPLLTEEIEEKNAREILKNWFSASDLNYQKEDLKEFAEVLAQRFDLPLSKTLYPIRIAISGQKVSPPIFESMKILGKEKSLERIKKALEVL